MKKLTNNIMLKMLPFLQKKLEKKAPRDYATLVEHFKTRVEIK